MLAYTNRFLALGSLIRTMQATGVLSLLLCVVCMFVLFAGFERGGKIAFGRAWC